LLHAEAEKTLLLFNLKIRNKRLKPNSNLDLIIINILSLLFLAIVVISPSSFIRTIIALPFLLLFPGYTFVSALFPGKKSVSNLERIVLSIGLSIVLVPLIGLALNSTPYGITLTSTVLSVFTLTIIVSVATHFRRSLLPLNERFLSVSNSGYPKRQTLAALKYVIVGVALSVIITSSIIIYVNAQNTDQRYSEFYLLDAQGTINNYPKNITLGQSILVSLNIVNHEYADTNYAVTVTFNNQTIFNQNNITLTDQAQWQKNITYTPLTLAENAKLEFLLYKENSTQPYHQLHLLINVNPKP
jgi:uncharacterized membrane protein